MPKSKFIEWEMQTLTINAGIGRGKPTYNKSANEIDKKSMRLTIRKKLREYSKLYEGKCVSEYQHVRNIRKFSDEMTKEHHNILADGKFRFGRSQKLLNLYLKYMWILGKIGEPPHCPVDSIVISSLGNKANIKGWTFIDSEDEYMEIIRKVKEKADTERLTIQKWELKLWNDNVTKS